MMRGKSSPFEHIGFNEKSYSPITISFKESFGKGRNFISYQNIIWYYFGIDLNKHVKEGEKTAKEGSLINTSDYITLCIADDLVPQCHLLQAKGLEFDPHWKLKPRYMLQLETALLV